MFKIKKRFALALTSTLILGLSCGRSTSGLDANVGHKPAQIPAKIEAESFNSAIDLTEGNRGHKCDATSNPNVDLEVANDDGAGCGIGWTQNGEIIDYFVLSSSKVTRKYNVDFRMASDDKDSEITLESPPGKVRGKISAFHDGYKPGWQSWVTRSLPAFDIAPGQQVIRLIFKGEQNLNYLVVNEDGKDIPIVSPKPNPSPKPASATAESVLKKSCVGCHHHNKFGNKDKINWAEIEKNAAVIKQRLTDKASPMPQKSAPQNLQINDQERSVLLAHVSKLSTIPAEQAKPIATKSFDSRGMQLQRDLMAENVGHIWGIDFLPNGDAILTIKDGRLKRFVPSQRKMYDIVGGPHAAQVGQGGLLDVGVSAHFESDKRVYFSYAKNVGGNRHTTALSVGELNDNKITNLREIFVATGSSETGEHFGGRIVVDDDASIWLSVGERNVRENSQKTDNHLGKILHLTAEGRAHPSNPFHGRAGFLAEIYSYGHRNPQGLAKNKLTGEMWESEHGPQGGDEINKLQKGGNFGWPIATYGENYGGGRFSPSSAQGTIQPQGYWVPSIAPSGLAVYSADLLGGWKGLVLSGALAFSHLNVTEYRDGRRVFEQRIFDEEDLRVRDVEQAPNGEVWYSSDRGHLFRIKKRN